MLLFNTENKEKKQSAQYITKLKMCAFAKSFWIPAVFSHKAIKYSQVKKKRTII